MWASRRSGLFWGPLLMVLGLGFLLNNFNLVPEGIFSLWPLLVVGAGLWLLVEALLRQRGRGVTGGVVVLALGVFWLLENYGRVTSQMFLPVLLIALGAGLLVQYFLPGRSG